MKKNVKYFVKKKKNGKFALNFLSVKNLEHKRLCANKGFWKLRLNSVTEADKTGKT